MARPKGDIDLKRNPDTGLWETHYSPPEKGVRRKAERHGTADEIVANEKHAIFVEQLKRGLLKDRDVTFGMLAKDYFAWALANERDSENVGKRQKNWETRFAPELEKRRVVDTDGEWLDKFFDRMRRGETATAFTVKGRARKALKPGTLHSYQGILSRILGHATKESRRLHHSLVPKFKMVNVPTAEQKAWSDHDAYVRVIGAAKLESRELYLFTALGLYTGHRSNVIYRLPWRLVDFSTRMLYCEKLKSKQRHERDCKKVVNSAMSEALFAALWDAHATACPLGTGCLSSPAPCPIGNELVLGNCGDLGNKFRKVLRALELDGSPHWMRHTFVTSLRRQGVGFDDIAIMTGDDPRTLAKTYAWVQTPDVRKLYNLLPGSAMAQPPSPSDAPGGASPLLRRVK